MNTLRMIFLFLDGVGLGEDDPNKNPFLSATVPTFNKLFSKSQLFPTDACMGVEGLPQSATGQTAIFTGVNASKVLGRHLNAQPTESLKKIIDENNMFKSLLDMGKSVTNANVYRDEYLEKMLDPKERRYRPSVTSVMTQSAGINFRKIEDYQKGLGVYHDLTGNIMKQNGYNVDIVTTQESAERLFRISREYDFTLFEHFMTDIIGHKMDADAAKAHIEMLDSFIGHLIYKMNKEEDILFITSDHGNIEDISVKTHTKNLVPTVIVGEHLSDRQINIETLTDILPCVLEIFRNT